jgi:hypothetical protein
MINSIEHVKEINNNYYGRFMSYASKLRKANKPKEAHHVHDEAQKLNHYFYSAVHSNTEDMILYYNNKMQAIVVEVVKFMEKA